MHEIKNYYCYLKSAVINGDLKRAKLFSTLLSKQENKEVQTILPQEWYASYQRIKHNLQVDSLADVATPAYIRASDFNLIDPPIISQKQLINTLFENMDSVCRFFNVTDLKGFIEEYPTINQERVDLVIRDGFDTVYPIEIKPQRANHETIGQIRKYCNYFLHRLNFQLYTKVQGVVLAGSFDKTTMRELKKEGHMVLSYTIADSQNFRLLRL